MLAGLASTVVIFYVVARYRHPLVPIVLLFAAAGLSSAFDMRHGGAPPAAPASKPGRRRKPAARQQPAWSSGWARRWLPGLAGAAS